MKWSTFEAAVTAAVRCCSFGSRSVEALAVLFYACRQSGFRRSASGLQRWKP